MNVYFELDASFVFVLKLDGVRIYQGNSVFDWKTLLGSSDITGATHLFDRTPSIELTTVSNIIYRKSFEFSTFFPGLDGIDEYQLQSALQERRTAGLAWLSFITPFVKTFAIT